MAFVLDHDDPFVGIDLDQAVEEGQIAPWARSIIDGLHSYTEWSPSRQGLHIWLRGALPGPRRREGAIEVYQDLRALTITGWHLEGTPLQIDRRQEELEQFYWQLFPPEAERQTVYHQSGCSDADSDADLLARARGARNGQRFARLWAGDTSGYGGDHSRADLALCGMLAFWAAGDAERVDRLFRQSGLMRPKWDVRHYHSGETYGQRTIAHVLAGQDVHKTAEGSRSTAHT
jgi:putative DNA primase/helicase